MTEKRFIVIDDGLDFMVRDTFTGDDLIDADGVADVLNDYEEWNTELKNDNKRMVKFIMSKGFSLKDYLEWLKRYGND